MGDNSAYVLCLDRVVQLQKTIKRRRAGTFCFVASIGTLLISAVLLITALTSLRIEYDLYNRSVVTQCTLLRKDNANIDGSSANCIYRYNASMSSVSPTCDGAITEHSLCSNAHLFTGGVGATRPCAIYVGDADDESDQGADSGSDSSTSCNAIAVSFKKLQREHNMFVFVLLFGILFGVCSLATATYALCSAKLFGGFYSSMREIESDFTEMESALRELHSHTSSRNARDTASADTGTVVSTLRTSLTDNVHSVESEVKT